MQLGRVPAVCRLRTALGAAPGLRSATREPPGASATGRLKEDREGGEELLLQILDRLNEQAAAALATDPLPEIRAAFVPRYFAPRYFATTIPQVPKQLRSPAAVATGLSTCSPGLKRAVVGRSRYQLTPGRIWETRDALAPESTD
jgi:hypothetical protein